MDEEKKTTLNMEKFKKKIQEAVATISHQEARKLLDELSEALTPYIVILENEDLIKEELEKRGFNEDMYALADSDDPEKRKLFLDAFHAVVEAIEKKSEKDDSSISEECEQAIKVIAKKPDSIDFPVDKVNLLTWKLKDSQFGKTLKLGMEKKNSSQKINLYLSVDFDKLEDDVHIIRKLSPFDKRVYIAIGTLYAAQNDVITVTQIYHAMGSTGTPGRPVRERINDSLTKMAAAHISINNTEEAVAYKYPQFVYDASLLPMERISASINGKFTDSAIHLFREPPLISFARQRKQITTFNIKLLQSPISKTDLNLAIDDYLLTRISKAKRANQSCKILYTALYDYINLENESPANQKNIKKRLPGRVKEYLDYYVSVDGIKKYSISKDSVTIYF